MLYTYVLHYIFSMLYSCVILLCMCIYIYIHVCVYVCVYIYIHIHTYTCVYMYVCIYIYIYMYMYVCMYVCMYIYIYIYIYIHVIPSRPQNPADLAAGGFLWVFRDVVFRDVGFDNNSLKPLTHISFGCEVPTTSVAEGQSTIIFKPHTLKHHIPELPT